VKHEYTVRPDAAGQRLDKFLRKRFADVPLSHLYKLVRTKKVRVNGSRADIAQLLQPGDVVVVHAAQAKPESAPAAPRPASQVPQDFAILYEDAHILVCDKPAGLAIHPGSGIAGDTLVDEVRAYLERQGLVVPEGEFKPSPAHRLDRETSGVVVVAKTRQAMVRLTETFTRGEAKKSYLALAKGRFQRERGTIELRLAEHQQTAASRSQRGVNLQQAVTHWMRLGDRMLRPSGSAPRAGDPPASGDEATLLELHIETGRTHQIRRHLAAIGHPVAGDTRYGDFPFNRRARAAWGLRRMFLHSARLALAHPITGKRLSFEAPLPPELSNVLGRARIAYNSPSSV
jgi:23S rRNA pseudouridine955/2504/2580 synthase